MATDDISPIIKNAMAPTRYKNKQVALVSPCKDVFKIVQVEGFACNCELANGLIACHWVCEVYVACVVQSSTFYFEDFRNFEPA